MANSKLVDRVVVAVLLPLWAVCFALSLQVALGTGRFPPLLVSGPSHADGYPVVRELQRFLEPLPESPLPGDTLERLGDTDLRGQGAIDWWVTFYTESARTLDVPVRYLRAGELRVASLRGGSYSVMWGLLPVSLAYAFAAFVLAWRPSKERAARTFLYAFLTAAFYCAANTFGGPLETRVAIVLHPLALALLLPLHLRGLQRFPDVPTTQSLWSRTWPWLFAGTAIAHVSRFGIGLPSAVGAPLAAALVAAHLICALVLVTRRYRVSRPLERRRLRWFLLGLYMAAVPPLLGALAVALDPRLTPLYIVSLASVACFPLALLISINRFNLFDVDRLISSVAAYNVLILAAVGGSLLLVPSISAAASGLIGLDREVSQVVLSIAIAAALVPAQRGLRRRIERRFFADRFETDVGAEKLLHRLSACTSAQELTRSLGEGVAALLLPETCVIYGVDGEAYTPIFASGRAVPPGFSTHGPMAVTLRESERPLALGDSRRFGAEPGLGPFDRAVLDSLDAAVVVPIRREKEVLLVLCLSRKHSGDVYTPTDVRWLATVADVVSLELGSYEHDEILRQARKLQDALRRYVPSAVARELEIGHELERGERDVTVLFADIRGYVSYAERHAPGEIFRALNVYTKTVSDLVVRHGGQLVDFGGDGLMAVFGAPAPLASREVAAVAAARAIIAAVDALAPVGGEGDERLSAGVGVASGPAFVGEIGAADRLIWSVVGNTTNLAARLQALTRDFDASIAIDAATRSAAGAIVSDFEVRASVQIRGRTELEDVYVLRRA